MAPSRTSTVKSKHASNGSGVRSQNSAQKSGTKKVDGAVSKLKKARGKGAPPKAQKNAGKLATLRKKRRVYSEKELGIPELNMVTPVGVEKPRGGKKGKVFVDDRESMMTILAMVNANKEGQIESKMMKARQMEEIRVARRAEAEERQSVRDAKIDEKKDALRKKRKRTKGGGEESTNAQSETAAETKPLKQRKKSVAFA